MNQKRFILISLMMLIGFGLLVLPYAYAKAALVPCGLSQNDPSTPGDETHPCGTCDFFQLADNVKNFLMLDILTPVGVLFITIGGLMMMFGGASPGTYSRGKNMLTTTIWGIAFIFSAWMITNTIFQLVAGNSNISTSWYKISCTASGIGIGGNPTPTPSSGVTPNPTPTITTPGPGGGGTTLTCNVKGLESRGLGSCSNNGIATCLDCIKVSGSNQSVTSSLANLVNNSIIPQFRAAGIAFVTRDGMCPSSAHSSCAHFDGHALDIGQITDPAQLRKACVILNQYLTPLNSCSEMHSATRGAYIMEKNINAGSPCPRPALGCGDGSFHIQN